jgi:hypothetical protein
MKNFKLIPVLFSFSLALLLSTNSLVVAFTDNCCNCDWCGTKVRSEGVYSPDKLFRVIRPDSGSVIVERVDCFESDMVYGDTGLFSHDRPVWRIIFRFNNLVSFSFSKDSKYLLVERSEYNSKVGMQNDFIEIFDLWNEKRVFFMPFYKKCYPAGSYYSTKSYDLDDLVFLNFFGDTLQSVEFDFEGNYIFVPANLYNVRSVYASQLGLGLSVKFNDGSVKVYIPTKDFSGFNEVFSFGKSVNF